MKAACHGLQTLLYQIFWQKFFEANNLSMCLLTLGQSKVDTFWIIYWGLMVPRWPGPMWEPPSMFGQITEVRFFEKINFLCFLGPKKTFWPPKTLLGLKNPTFRASYFRNFLRINFIKTPDFRDLTWVLSDPSKQFKKYQLCSGLVCTATACLPPVCMLVNI